MGYTIYWGIRKAPKGQTAKVEAQYQLAVKECAKIALHWNNTCADFERLSGYTAHCKPGQYGGIKLNGKGSEAHEDFVMREHFNENIDGDCVKTAQKPYDIVVKACLAVFKDRLGKLIDMHADGRRVEDWTDGIELASKVLKRRIECPVELEYPSNVPDTEVGRILFTRKG